jgi:hypothetical protein
MRARRPNSSSPDECAPLAPSLQHLFPCSPPLPALSMEVQCLAQMRQSAVQGLRALRHSGLEVGGILTGRWNLDQPAGPQVCVTGQIPVEIAYQAGPRYVASNADLQTFRERMEALPLSGESLPLPGESAVGWWRSHTPDEDLTLSQTDILLSRALFQASPAVVLVVRPDLEGSCFAALHLVGNESIESSPPFPFEPGRGMSTGQATSGNAADAVVPEDDHVPEDNHVQENDHIPVESHAIGAAPTACMDSASPPWVEEAPEPIAASQPPPRDVPASPSPAVSRTRWWKTRRNLAASALVAASLAGAFVLLQDPRSSDWFLSAVEALREQPTSAPEAPAPDHGSQDPADSTAAATPAGIELRVAWLRGGLQLEWDRQSTMIQTATQGKLEVDDGDRSKTIVLSAADLRSGTITWFPRTEAVRFVLTVTGEAGEGQGLLQAHGFRQPGGIRPAGTGEAAGGAAPVAPRAERVRATSARPAPRQATPSIRNRPSAFRGGAGAAVSHSEAQPESPAAPMAGHQIASLENAVPPQRPSPLESLPGAGQHLGGVPRPGLPQCRSTVTAMGYYEKRSPFGFLNALRKLPFIPGDEAPREKPFVAPATIAATCPDLASAHLAKQPEWVDVIAEINRDGVVESATATGQSEHTYVAYRTVESVRSWRFRPATVADSSVESKVRLRVYWSYPPSESAANTSYPAQSVGRESQSLSRESPQ